MQFLTQNFGYVVLMIISAGMIVWPDIDRFINGGSEIGTFEATLLMNQKRAIVLDVRASGDFQKAHIPGARHIPEAEIKTRLTELSKFKDLLLASEEIHALVFLYPRWQPALRP